MTQPDRWDEMAIQLWCKPKHSRKTVDADLAVDIAAALRSAYAEGERAGIARLEPTDAMTRVGAQALFGDIDEDDDYFVRRFRVGLEAAIRAAKETKE